MTAFNARLRPKEVFGFPLLSVLLALVALMCVFVALVPPYPVLNIAAGVVAVIAFLLAVMVMAAGDEIVFLRVRLLGARERRAQDMLDIE